MRSPLLFTLPLVLFASCRAVTLTQTDFLAEQQEIAEDVGDSSQRIFVREDVDWSSYDSVRFEPLEFHLVEGSEKPDENQRESLAEWMDETLREELDERLRTVTEPRSGSLRIRSAVTDIDLTSFWINMTLALALIPLDVGGATVELEILDASTGQRLAALVNCDRANLLNMISGMFPTGHAEQALTDAAEWVASVTRTGQTN